MQGCVITTGGPSPRSSQWSSTPSGSGSFGTVRDLADWIARPDGAAFQDVRAQSAAVREAAQHAGLREALEVSAGLAQLDADALHLAHEEVLAHERVEPCAARDDLAPALRRSELDAVLRRQRLERLGLDQRDVAARLLALALGQGVPVLAVAHESLAGHRLHLGHLAERPRGVGPDVDRLYAAFAQGRKRATLSATQTG